MAIKLIAQALVFILENVQWKSPGPALSEINEQVRRMAKVARDAR